MTFSLRYFLEQRMLSLRRAVRQAASTEQLSECYHHTLARSEWRCCAGRRACRSHRRPEIALGSTPPDTGHPRREHPPVRVQLLSALERLPQRHSRTQVRLRR